MDVDIVDFSTLKPAQMEAWLQLFESTPNVRFYHHPHWLRNVAEHLAVDTLDIAFVSINQQLQMALPLCNSKAIRRRLHPAHEHLSLNDILIHSSLSKNPQALFSCINAALNKVGENSLDWQISNGPQQSAFIKALVANNQLSNQPSNQSDLQATSSWLQTESGAVTDHWLLTKARESANFDCGTDTCPSHSKLKRNLRRLRNQMHNAGNLRIEHVSEPDQLETAFEHFLKTEASGWKGQSLEASAISAHPALVNFYSALLTPSERGITPEINLLWSDEHCVAAQFGLRTGHCLSLLKIGYDEDFAKFSPGYLLLESVLADAPLRGIETLNLVTSPPWADRWHPETEPVWHINRYNNSTQSSALQQIDRLKQVAKSRLSKAA